MTNPDNMTVREMCIYMHEVFTSLIEAGFGEEQALRLLAEMLRRPSNPEAGR